MGSGVSCFGTGEWEGGSGLDSLETGGVGSGVGSLGTGGVGSLGTEGVGSGVGSLGTGVGSGVGSLGTGGVPLPLLSVVSCAKTGLGDNNY